VRPFFPPKKDTLRRESSGDGVVVAFDVPHRNKRAASTHRGKQASAFPLEYGHDLDRASCKTKS
jgi:hypothetical protein